GLEAVAGRMQQRSNRAPADRVALSAQLFGQPPSALARPAQRRLRVTPARRLDHRFQSRNQLRIVLSQPLASAPRPSDPSRLEQTLLGRQVQLRQPGGDRHARKTRRPRHRGDTAPTQPSGLRGRPLPPQPFVHLRPQRLVDAPNPFGNLCILHARLKGPKPPVSRKIVQVIFGQALIDNPTIIGPLTAMSLVSFPESLSWTAPSALTFAMR